MSTPHRSHKIARSPLLALFVALVFLAGPMPGPVEVVDEASAQSTGLQVTEGDYQTAVTDIHGIGAYAYVVLTRDASDTTEQRDVVKGVKVTSTVDSTGVLIDLLETGPETGVFIGGFGFDKTTRQTPGVHPFLGALGFNNATETARAAKVIVADDSTVTVAGGSDSTTFTWHDSVTAIPVLTPTGGNILGASTPIAVRIQDRDLDVSSSADAHDDVLFVRTDSDPEGRFLTITETGPTTGNFTTSIQLRTTASGGPADSLFVRPDDTITATLHEAHNAQGLPRVEDIGTWTFKPATNGQVLLDGASYVGNTTGGVESGVDRAVVTVIDGDPNVQATANTVTVQAIAETAGGSAQDCVELVLQQLPGSAIGQNTPFIGTLAFNAAAVEGTTQRVCTGGPGGDAVLDVLDGQTIRIKYSDSPDRNGVTTPRETTAVWRLAKTATVTLGESLDQRIVRGQAQFNIEVTDTDSNRNPNAAEQIRTVARSDTTPTGLEVFLIETGSNTGRFSGTLRFSPTAVSGRLHVTDGDLVTVEYVDPVNKTGQAEIVSANRGQAIFWRADHVATVFTDATVYQRMDASTSDDTIANVIDVFVEDLDANDPTQRDTVHATAFSHPATGGTLDQVQLTLDEVGVDSGLFHTTMLFEAGAGSAGNRLAVGSSGQIDFVIEYTDEVEVGSQPRTASTGTLVFRHVPADTSEALLRLERDPDGATGPRTPRTESRVIVDTLAANTEVDINIVLYAPGEGASVTAILESAACNENSGPTNTPDQSRAVTLNRAGPDSRYAAAFKIADAADGCQLQDAADTFLGVDIGQDFWINITLGDGTLLSKRIPTAALQREQITIENKAGQSVENVGGVNAHAFVKVTGHRHNYDAGSRQVITVPAEAWRTGATSAVTVNLVAAETAPDSGVFRGSYTFDATSPLPTAAELEANQAFPVAGHESITRVGEAPGYEMYVGVDFKGVGGRVLDRLTWWAGGPASIEVDRQGFGSQGFRVLLTDQDAFPNRVVETATGSTTEDDYAFGDANFVRGSDFVYREETQTLSPVSGSDGHLGIRYALEGTGGSTPAEAVADRNHDGHVDCGDFVLTAERDTNGIGPGHQDVPSSSIRCVGVTTSGVTHTVTVDFVDASETATCRQGHQPIGQAVPTVCRLVIEYQARAKAVNACTSESHYLYRHTATGIKFCDEPAAPVDLTFSYLKGTRTMKAQSRETPTSPVLETVTFTLTYDLARSASRGVPTFTGTVPVQTTAANDQILHVAGDRSIVRFTYNDPMIGRTGGPGSDVFENLRAVRAEDQWRAAGAATIKVMRQDYGAEASTPVLGPAVFVEVVDKDSNRSPSQETITVIAADAANGGETVEMTLRESEKNSGVFRGILEISASAAPGSGTVLNFGGSSGTIRFSFTDPHKANGETQTFSRNVGWRDAKNADILLFDEDNTLLSSGERISGTLGKLFVEVQDADANKNSGIVETVQARVHSIYDPVGEVVTLTERSTSSDTFRSSGIEFQTRLIEGDGRIFTRDFDFDGDGTGDEVFVTYEDPLGADGNRFVETSHRIGWDQLFDGIVSLDLAFYIGTDVTSEAHLAEAHVTVSDGDANTNPRQVDKLVLGTNGGPTYSFGFLDDDAISGTRSPNLEPLIETGANTGVFIGVATFKDATSGEVHEDWAARQRAVVPMTNTESLRFEYHDDDPASGSSTILTTRDTAQWYEAGYGVLGFDKSGYNDISVPVVLRLYDADLTTAPAITVASEANTQGVSVTLAKKRTGVFEGTLALRDASGGDTGLLVNDVDELSASYTDANPPGVREALATIRIDDFDPPVTTIATTPATPDGENGWFVTAPTVSFTANEPIQNTFYRLDGGGVRQFSTGFTVEEGLHTLEFWSVDSVGNEEEPKEGEVKFDATAPTASVANLSAESAPAGAITLSWAPVAAKTNPLEFGSYHVFQGTTSNKVGNSTTESFTHTPASDGTHTYLVAVADAAGNVDASKAVSVSGISDRVAPRTLTASVSPDELFEEIDDDLTVQIQATVHQDDLSDVDRVEAAVLDPFGEGVANVTLAREGTSNVWRGTFDAFEISGDYVFKVAALDVAGNAAPLDRAVTFHAIDRDPPRVTVPEAVVQGEPLNVVVTDNDKGIATISYRLDGGSPVNVAVPDGPKTHTFPVQTSSLALGSHAISVSVADLNGTANFATYDLTFTVTDSSGTAPPPSGSQPGISLVSPFAEKNGHVKLRVVSSGPLTVLTVAFDGGAAQSVLGSWAGPTSTTNVPVGSLSAGTRNMVVTATNAGGTTTETFQVIVLPEGVPLPPSNVQVVRGADGFPKVTWTASESTNVGGYLVHRSSSPYTVIAVLGADATEHTDRTADRGKTYKYAVTAYSTSGQGQLSEGDASETTFPWLAEIEGTSFRVEDPDSNFWTVFWVILILLVVVTAVVLLVVYRERIFRPKEEGEIYDDEYPDGSGTATLPFGEEQHDLRCPNCTTEFSVTGEKPIVTTCPNCGKKGILR